MFPTRISKRKRNIKHLMDIRVNVIMVHINTYQHTLDVNGIV